MFVVRPGLIFIHNDCLKLKTYPLIRYCETMTGCKGKSILPDWIINHDGWLNVSNLPLRWTSKHDDCLKVSNLCLFFSRPSPKAGRELQTALDMMDAGGREDGPLVSRSQSPGRESTQRLCTCLYLIYLKIMKIVNQ